LKKEAKIPQKILKSRKRSKSFQDQPLDGASGYLARYSNFRAIFFNKLKIKLFFFICFEAALIHQGDFSTYTFCKLDNILNAEIIVEFIDKLQILLLAPSSGRFKSSRYDSNLGKNRLFNWPFEQI